MPSTGFAPAWVLSRRPLSDGRVLIPILSAFELACIGKAERDIKRQWRRSRKQHHLERQMAERWWLPPHEALWKSAQWVDALAAQYELWNLSGDPLHSIDKELPRGEVEDTYIIAPHLVITAPTPEMDDKWVLQPCDPAALAAFRNRVLNGPGPTTLIESHHYIDGSALYRMWNDAGCPNPGAELRARLKEIKAERKASYARKRAEWQIRFPNPATIRSISPIKGFVGGQTLAPGTYAVVTPPEFDPVFATGNRAMVSFAQKREAKAKAPKRRRGRPVTRFPHDRWFDGFTLATTQQRNPMKDLLTVAAINTRNPIKAQEAVSDALWLAARKLRRDPTRVTFRSQEKFNAWLRAFVRRTVNRYRDERWGDLTRRRKENVVLVSGLDVAYAELHAFIKNARSANKKDMERQDERACRNWRAKGPEPE